MLEITDFKKYYGRHLVLDIPSVFFEQGIHWIKGTNGSGKSTMFKCIAGLLPFEGKIGLDGQYESNVHPVVYRKLVNYGEAEPLYPDYLTGNDLIAFVAKTKGTTKEQADMLVETLEIGEYIKQPTGSYSSGMLKKLSLVLAFLGNPRLIILDEPLITIDAKAAENVFKLVHLFNSRYGVGFLISSHQLFEDSDLPVTSQYLVQNQTITMLT